MNIYGIQGIDPKRTECIDEKDTLLKNNGMRDDNNIGLIRIKNGRMMQVKQNKYKGFE